MSQGLTLPFFAQQGRLSLSSGEDQLTKIIASYLSDGDSENPFQDLGDLLDVVFQTNDEETSARMRVKIKQIFTRLQTQRRAALAPGSPKFKTNADTHELECEILYTNLETTERKTLAIAFDPSGLARILPTGV